MTKIGFARVSVIHQDLPSQTDALKMVGCEKIFSGKQSGAAEKNSASWTKC